MVTISIGILKKDSILSFFCLTLTKESGSRMQLTGVCMSLTVIEENNRVHLCMMRIQKNVSIKNGIYIRLLFSNVEGYRPI